MTRPRYKFQEFVLDAKMERCGEKGARRARASTESGKHASAGVEVTQGTWVLFTKEVSKVPRLGKPQEGGIPESTRLA